MEKVVTLKKEQLAHEHLLSVAKKEKFALHIKEFCDPELLRPIRENLMNSNSRGSLSHAQEFGRIGFAYSEIKDVESRDHYHDSAVPNINKLRSMFTPYLSPIDEFRLILEERWNWGATLLQVDQKKCFVGIYRYQDPTVDLNPHTDNLSRNLPEKYQQNLLNQLSVNVYVSMPAEGGELELWDIEPTEQQYAELMGGRHYGIDRDRLPPPSVVVKPSVGDLIVLNPKMIHAVRPGSKKSRITVSTFVGFMGEGQPLVYWS